MRSVIPTHSRPVRWAKRFGLVGLGLIFVAVTGCEKSLTEHQGSDAPASEINLSMTSETWHQGFEDGTEGWFGGETPGVIGWCGTITQVDQGSGSVPPSAGQGHATVEQGTCNDFYDAIFSAPGPSWSTPPGRRDRTSPSFPMSGQPAGS